MERTNAAEVTMENVLSLDFQTAQSVKGVDDAWQVKG
jgi:hypothetical protein